MTGINENQVIPIVVINWNGIGDTLECLESLLKLNRCEYKIYLLDNGSDHQEGFKLSDQYIDHPKIEVRCFRENLGFTRANNIILEELKNSEYNYVALLNNDTIVDKDWLYQLHRCALEQKVDVVSSKIINYSRRNLMDNAGHKMLNTGEIVPIGYKENCANYEKRMENFGSCAAGTLYSLDMIRKIGSFDEYFTTGYEDAEFGVRAYITGHRCIYEPTAIVYHKIGRSVGKIFDTNYAIKTQADVLYSYFKLMPPIVILANLPFMIIRQCVMILSFILFFRFKYINILYLAYYKIFITDRNSVFRNRKNFMNTHKLISSFKIIAKQEFFLVFDLRRLIKHLIKKKPSALDSYRDN